MASDKFFIRGSADGGSAGRGCPRVGSVRDLFSERNSCSGCSLSSSTVTLMCRLNFRWNNMCSSFGMRRSSAKIIVARTRARTGWPEPIRTPSAPSTRMVAAGLRLQQNRANSR